MKEYTIPVKKYWMKVTKDEFELEHTILAKDSSSALSIAGDLAWDTITLQKISDDIVAYAQYTARDISGEHPSRYLHYHARPA